MTEDPRTPDLGAAAVSGLRWNALARPTIEIVLFGSMIVLARLIPPAEFGRFAIAMIVTELALNIPNEGVGSAIVQRKSIVREHLETGFALTLAFGIAMAALTFALAGIAIDPVFGERTAELVRLSIPTFMIAAFATVPLAMLRRRLAFGTLSVLDLTATSIRAAVAVGLAIAGFEAEGLVLAGLLSASVLTIVAWIVSPAPAPRLRISRARELLRFGAPASLASISWVGFRNCDYAVIGARLGALQAGYYFRAYSLAIEYQKKISTVMAMLAFPLFSRTTDLEEMARVRTQMVRTVTVALFPLFIGLAILAPEIVPWVFGAAWEPAVVPTQILAIGGAVTLVSDSVGAALMAAGRARSVLAFGWSHFLVYGCAVFLVAPRGIAAVAGAAVVVHAAFLFVAYWLMLRGSGDSVLRRLWWDAGPATVSCLACSGVAVPVALALTAGGASGLLTVAAVTACGGSVYLITLRTLFPDAWRTAFSWLRRVLPGDLVPRLRALAPAGARQGP